jgi:alpha-galactosidase
VFRALRHVPQLVAIAHDMEDLCPDAWLFNYTNPMSVLCRAVQRESRIKSAGLCHGILETRHRLARWLGVDYRDLRVKAAGLNHLAWVLDLRAGRVDLYPRLRALGAAALRRAAGQSALDDPEPEHEAEKLDLPVSLKLMEIYGYFPSPGDRHVAEFFPFFLKSTGDSAHGRGRRLAYGLTAGLDMTYEIIEGKGAEWDKLRRQAAGALPLDDELFAASREGERLVKIVEAIVEDTDMLELAVNVPNDGYIANLPPEAIVEVPALIGGYGLRPIGMGALPDGIAAVLTARVRQQEMTVEAALSGDRSLALQALLADPLVRDVESARAMLDDALEAHAEYLPQFGRRMAQAR